LNVTHEKKEKKGREKPEEVKGPSSVVEMDAHLACPECGKETVRIGVKASTTIWFTCTNPDCSIHGEHHPPAELA
jgi:ribosomal protein L37AE/L43A